MTGKELYDDGAPDGCALEEALEGAPVASHEPPGISALIADKQIVGKAAMATIHKPQTTTILPRV